MEELIVMYKYIPYKHTNEEWVKLFYDEFIKLFPQHKLFLTFFVPNAKDFNKKIQYMSEMFEKGKSTVDIYDIIENYTNDLWD